MPHQDILGYNQLISQAEVVKELMKDAVKQVMKQIMSNGIKGGKL